MDALFDLLDSAQIPSEPIEIYIAQIAMHGGCTIQDFEVGVQAMLGADEIIGSRMRYVIGVAMRRRANFNMMNVEAE